MLLITIFGWVGIALVLSAYILVSVRKIMPNSIIFQALNLLGAVGILLDSWTSGAWPATVLFIIWGVMAIISLITMTRR